MDNLSEEKCIQVNYWFDSSLNSLAAKLDAKMFMSGYSSDVYNWDHQYSLDPYWRLYLPMSGRFDLLFDAGEYKVVPGFMTLVPADVPFNYRAVLPCTHYWLHFYSDELKKHYPLRYPLQIAAKPEEEAKRFAWFVNKEIVDKTASSITSCIQVHNALLELLAPFLEMLNTERYQSRQDEKFEAVLSEIENELPDEVDLARLARIAGLGRAAFSSSFRARFGMGPYEYIILRRISMAKMALIHTTLSIKEIAANVGYENCNYFYRVFRRLTSMTPQEYRDHKHIM